MPKSGTHAALPKDPKGAWIRVRGRVVEGSCVRRSKRFVVTAETSQGQVQAFLAHTGRLGNLVYPGANLSIVGPLSAGTRTLQYDVLASRQGDVEVVVDTRLPNALVHRALEVHAIRGLPAYSAIQTEVPLGDSRIDFSLLGAKGTAYLEVKSCSLSDAGVALFPDAPSEREARHLKVLASALRAGDEAAMLFLATRPDVSEFRPNEDADPVFAHSLRSAQKIGLRVRAYNSRLKGTMFYLGSPLRVCL